jgi:MFS family permease
VGAAPWLTDVAGLERWAVVGHLVLMAAVLSASALLLGALAERLRRAGIPTELFLAGTLALSMVAQLALLLGLPVSSHLLFAIIASAGATPVLSFAILARYFPKEVAGRANAALGVLNMGTAFGLQCLAGVIIAQWPADGGHYPAQAHQAALAAGLALHLVGLAVFLSPKRRAQPMPMCRAVARVLGVDSSIRFDMPAQYAAALSAWTARRADAHAGDGLALRCCRFHGVMHRLGWLSGPRSQRPRCRASSRPGERAARRRPKSHDDGGNQ